MQINLDKITYTCFANCRGEKSPVSVYVNSGNYFYGGEGAENFVDLKGGVSVNFVNITGYFCPSCYYLHFIFPPLALEQHPSEKNMGNMILIHCMMTLTLIYYFNFSIY